MQATVCRILGDDKWYVWELERQGKINTETIGIDRARAAAAGAGTGGQCT